MVLFHARQRLAWSPLGITSVSAWSNVQTPAVTPGGDGVIPCKTKVGMVTAWNNFSVRLEQRPDTGCYARVEMVLFHARQRLAWSPLGITSVSAWSNVQTCYARWRWCYSMQDKGWHGHRLEDIRLQSAWRKCCLFWFHSHSIHKFSHTNFISIWLWLLYASAKSHGCFPVKSPNYFLAEAPSNPILILSLKFPTTTKNPLLI